MQIERDHFEILLKFIFIELLLLVNAEDKKNETHLLCCD